MSLKLSKTKIDYLFITNSLSGGGAERAINIAVNELSNKKILVGLLVINDGPQDLYAPKVPTFEINRKWQGGVFSLILAFMKTYVMVARLKPKILILNCDLPEFIGAFLFGPWKLVVVEHVTKPWSDRLVLGKLIRRILRIRNSSWVVVSDHLKPWLSEDIATEHIPNAIYEQGESNVNQVICGNEIGRLVFIGRLTKNQKQPQWMLDISEISKLPVAFYGDGLYREDLISDSKIRNLDAKFHGFVFNPWSEISSGDLLIVPSAWEGDGLVVVEALSRGVPILLNSVPDLARFKLPEKHYCKDPDDFASRILLYKNNLKGLVAGNEIAHKIVSGRNPENVATRWINFFRETSK
jgi:glycosyltransferase involved in cell wall biosynthesis